MIDSVASLIKQFQDGVVDDPHDLKAWALRHSALPVIFDMGGCFALRADGTVVAFSWDTPDSPEVQTQPRLRNMVLFRAGQLYPRLAELSPIRPPDALTCPHCHGSGVVPLTDQLERKGPACYCGGLGWIPPSD